MKKITENVYSVGAIDWDRKYFDEIIYLPEGTSYNSYLIIGSEKTALIDTVDPTMTDVLLENLKTIKKIDYIISNHGEQDHSGSINAVLQKYPECKIVCNELNKKILMDEHFLEESNFIIMNDYDKLSLGDKTLQFIFTPWVHWPETMCTYLIEDRILFTCDFFGSHIATSDLYADENIYLPAKRYYSEIMMPFANIITKNLEKIRKLDIEIIAPSHGPMYNNPEYPLSLYEEWTSKKVKPEVVIVYISMHGSTKGMVKYLVTKLIEKGITVKEYNVLDVDAGKIAMDLVDASTLIVASPTYLGGLHPKIASILYLANSLHPKTKILTFIGSYEWGSNAPEQFKQLTNNFKAELIEPTQIKGLLKENKYSLMDSVVEKVISKHIELGIIQNNIEHNSKNQETKEVNIVLCGEAGQGIESIFNFLSQILKNEGYNIFATKEYMSRVRGGENSTTIRVSSKPIEGYINRIDVLLPLNKNAINHLSDRISEKTIIIGDKKILGENNEKIFDVPIMDIASNIGSKIFANTVATGIILGIFNSRIERFHELIRKSFSDKPSNVVEQNIQAANKGYEEGQRLRNNNYIRELFNINTDKNVQEQILLHGSESIGIGAIAGGCNFISAYPMSPSTGVLTYMASKKNDFGIIVEQAEDEISAINMAIGAWYAGARALANTSGGGFALMTEGVSLAGMIESPIVIHIAQRPGPATGLPTRTAQEDLNLALYSGHGEFCRLIYAPGNLIEGIYLTQKAFNAAAKYQIPVFILTDQYFIDTVNNVPLIDLNNLNVEHHIIKTSKDYKRYSITDNGISPRGIPGFGEGTVCVDSDEHDEYGRITENMNVRNIMVEKRMKKHKLILEESIPPKIFGEEENYDILIISWGSTYGTVKEAVETIISTGIKREKISYLHYSQVYPLHPKTEQYLKKARKIIVIENNSTGQFANLIKKETGIKVEKILKYNGLPFSVEELVEKISRTI
ncbi:MAG: hypothetical protein KatS3mg002_0696 [Candidatus Woesearchaeota archaeon]|nr:MAG: hypothetical protein KatS3mg002_0696 [Candidatus Woesearchaeota archaeon]